jgi:hypothetical protein
MFKIGDKVVCIRDFFGKAPHMKTFIKVGTIYSVTDIDRYCDASNFPDVINEYEIKINSCDYWFQANRFISLAESRQLKLKKILENVRRISTGNA